MFGRTFGMLRGSTLHFLSVFLIHRKKYSTYAPSGLTISRLAIIDEKTYSEKGKTASGIIQHIS